MEDNNLNSKAKENNNNTAERNISNSKTDNKPLLRSFGFSESESNTTNIPPRLPMGYIYNTPEKDNGLTNEEQQESPLNLIEQHPDMPNEKTLLRNKNCKSGKSINKAHRKRRTTKNKLKRYTLCTLLLIVLVLIGTTYVYWRNDTGPTNDSAHTLAADSILPVKHETIDSISTKLSHEDSLRIKDSVRHAQWLYRKRQKSAKETIEQTVEENQNTTETVTTERHTEIQHDTLK